MFMLLNQKSYQLWIQITYFEYTILGNYSTENAKV